MRKFLVPFVLLALFMSALSAKSQDPQKTVAGTSPFAGRWEIQMILPPNQPEPFAIIEIEQGVSGITGKLIAHVYPTGTSVKLGEISEKEGLLSFTIEISVMGTSMGVKFQGKRVTDHLEGTMDMTLLQATWTGQPTTKDKFEKPEDKKAMEAAQMKPPAERAEALRQFLKNFPDSSLKDQANYYLAISLQKPEERTAALRKFLQDFPNTSLKEQASLQIAQSLQDPAEKKAALRKFLADFPTSRMKDQAEYQLIRMIDDPDERRAAQEKFVKDYPKSMSAQNIYRTLLELQLQTKPVDEAKVNGIIDSFINSTPDPTGPSNTYITTLRADALNTIADRLMEHEVLLDRALELIQKAVAMSDNVMPQIRATLQTTLGQVYFKRKEYDQAEKELKKAIEMAGEQKDAETILYLGKVYEARNNDDAALDAYVKAASLASSTEIKSSLERAYRKKYGSLDGLEEKLDTLYLARPKPFDPGRYTPSGKESGRVVLVELFTGSECPPCVAADQAFDGLGERYDRDIVAILVYHLHIPGPDPMTNPDTESRAKYYQVGSTPTAMIDGIDQQAGGGASAQSPIVFNNYKGKIEARLLKPPLATFSDVKIKLEAQTLTVSGQVNIAPESAGKAEKARLRIALVEDVVRYTGGNGVRFHNFVVRKLMGTPEGRPLEKPGTNTSFSESVNITTLGENQKEYLTKYETETAGKLRPGFKFAEKLDRIEPTRLLIVAFLQDDQTKEILQACFAKPGR